MTTHFFKCLLFIFSICSSSILSSQSLSISVVSTGSLGGSEPEDPGRFIDCEEAEDILDELNDFLCLKCNCGVGPHPEDLIDICYNTVEVQDYIQGQYDKLCTEIALQAKP